MAEESKVTKLCNWLADHPKTLRYLADNPGIFRWVGRYGDNIEAIINVFSKDSEPPKPSEITGIAFDIKSMLKYGVAAGIGFIIGRGQRDDE